MPTREQVWRANASLLYWQAAAQWRADHAASLRRRSLADLDAVIGVLAAMLSEHDDAAAARRSRRERLLVSRHYPGAGPR